jgi:murein L,D-transpeptidase YcbB/YkuD
MKLCLWPVLAFLILFTSPLAATEINLGGEEIRAALGGTTSGDLLLAGTSLNREDLDAFYKARDYRLAWDFTGTENAAAFAAFLDSIERVIEWHGLLHENYPLDTIRAMVTSHDETNHVTLELLVSGTLLRLARDLHGDDIDLDDLYPGWNFHRTEIDIPTKLADAVAANNVNTFIDGLAPQSAAYQALARALRQYRDLAAKGLWPTIDAGPALHLHDHGGRVTELRLRLEAEGYLSPGAQSEKMAGYFDDDVRKALIDYQQHNGLESDGNMGLRTLAALNVPLALRIDQIRANMERARHMPEDFPPLRYTLVNIPDASVRIVEDGQTIYEGPVIVGQVERKTPFIQSSIRSMIINPSWHVPAKIAREDILPKLRADPHYLEKLGFTIKGSDNDPYGQNIDWKSLPDEEFDFHLRQEPGRMNSLGRLKFDFDNDFAVYLHGTPHQELFKKNARDLSSGCVRLRDPAEIAQILLAGTPGAWDAQHLEDAIATQKTRWVGIKNPMPLFILYQTVFMDPQAKLEFREDVYGYDQFLMQSLKPAPSDAKTEDIPTQ